MWFAQVWFSRKQLDRDRGWLAGRLATRLTD
jgi:hypothetical protein